ncbi:MAG: hypothetical protein UW35_C0014G0002 [Candidatus Collierbacteria bacterium GW2011_GWF2_44_15]|uniref:PT repeat-containing protein n=4 Tax=Candidatus Collieribacteriota TaxID=1752725 RepID=A0A0G1KEX1_9BACT|nr:MAG: hypothetical protein UW23_C0009G0037 [Candidatus Collierbacteria bacterium GW2011_GWA1_44_12]KKT38805.1 MAG: hypothetical protein UW26_C0012G0020 [Candidatus Collierbacteria bacterium GW2011_GWF1_44_12]KKT46419.1 MAG: hypothetical protein UW35_C0014G0002 [Candidatus Collierbacteria bacterium GW2011_GWF2_44_15]KKU30586.1 MAG: hypothetical protein UX41_C0001G0055 [Candidatus Collierbacteria bacterium GW2011_GWE1_46_18]
MPDFNFSPKIIAGLIAAYIASAGVTYAITPAPSPLISPGSTVTQEEPGKSGSFLQYANEPKTEVCPLNGALYSKSEKALWERRRPILTMIENHTDARPQSGLSLADIVYEAVAEGGITRFMGVFYCGAQQDVARVAPVRSARMYFVNLAAEYNTPIFMHVGGGNCSRDEASKQCTSNKKAWAIEELAKLGWRKPQGNDFDTISDIGYPVMLRDYNRLGADKQLATEHTMVGSLPAAWKEAEKRGYAALMPAGSTWLSGFTTWKFDAESNVTGSPATNVKFDFWANYNDFTVEWKYDPASKAYLRNQGGQPQTDLDTTTQLKASAVVIQYVKEEGPLDEHKHMYYEVVGTGKGLLFQGGKGMEINWKKAKQTGKTIFTDKSGKEVVFLPGQIWIELLPSASKVTYQ